MFYITPDWHKIDRRFYFVDVYKYHTDWIKIKFFQIDVAIDDVSGSDGACPLQTFCDFETPEICGFSNNQFASFNFKQRRGRSPYSSDGPTTDHVKLTVIFNFEIFLIILLYF